MNDPATDLYVTESSLLRLYGVTKNYKHGEHSIEVLKDISFSIKPGESIAIVGASGSGKTTLLNIIGSLDPPTEGKIVFNNTDLYSMNERQLSKLRNKHIGFIFQFHYLLNEFNALENTMIPAMIARLPKKQAKSMAESILIKVGLAHRLTHRIGELSGGERQRVAIARALVMRPSLLLADEPTGSLDWHTGEEVAELLLFLQKNEKLAMVVATHNKNLADRLSCCFELKNGKIQ